MSVALENGTLSTLRQPDEEWILPVTAADILCVSIHSLYTMLGPADNYSEIRRRLRGNGTSPRGQGQLFYAPDIHRIARIRRVLRCHPAVALRVFAAQRRGEL